MATLNIAELATTLDASPREVRKFLRSIKPADEQPGKGGRWAIEKREVRSLASKFAKYREEAAQPAPEAHDDADPADEGAAAILGDND